MLTRLRTWASFVRFSHTIFALPFALTGALLAGQTAELTWARAGWIVIAMFTARTAAMAFNRLVDARFDALNPRTTGREIPRGLVSRTEAGAIAVVASLAFVASTYPLGMLCFTLSPVALAIVFWYSLAKRYTTYTQLFLGLGSGGRPGRRVAGRREGSSFAWPPWLLALATGMWVAGIRRDLRLRGPRLRPAAPASVPFPCGSASLGRSVCRVCSTPWRLARSRRSPGWRRSA